MLSNSVALAGHVVIEDGAYLSGLVAVHQFARIGMLAFIAAGSFVDRSVLPFTIAAGPRVRIRTHNRVGLSRANWSSGDIERARRLIRAYKAEGLGFLRRLDAARSPQEARWSDFCVRDTRGLAPALPLTRLDL